MENIKLNIEKTLDLISKEKLASYEPKVQACMETLAKDINRRFGTHFTGANLFMVGGAAAAIRRRRS